MSGLGTAIAAQLRAWGTDRLPNERARFGTEDPDTIAAVVDGWCRTHLGSRVARYRFFDSSSGSVHGVELADGRAVVVKGHRSAVDPRYLAAIVAVQRTLADTGFPAPRPLAGPVPLGDGLLTAEEYRSQSRPADAHDPAVRAVLAAQLVRFIARAEPHRTAMSALVHPLHRLVDGLYPVPHSERFDFAATADGAEWIDGLMRAARDRTRGTRAGPDRRRPR